MFHLNRPRRSNTAEMAGEEFKFSRLLSNFELIDRSYIRTRDPRLE